MAQAKKKKKKKKEGTAWLADLEARVHEAAEAVRRLRQENNKLRKQLQNRQEEGGSSSSEIGWERERQELRRRVEKLARGLEKLLEESH